jgi:hypothetical protein
MLYKRIIESDINGQILIVLVYIVQVQIFVMICYDSKFKFISNSFAYSENIVLHLNNWAIDISSFFMR